MEAAKRTNAEKAREKMISRMMRKDSAANVLPEINAGVDLVYFLDSERKSGLFCLCEDAALKAELVKAAAQVWTVFKDQIRDKPITGFILYEAEKQGGDYRLADGMAVQYTARKGDRAWKIAIAAEAIRLGREYLLFLVIHELAHVLHGVRFDHPPEWHAALDQMLAEFEQRTGIHLENDYSSYNGEGKG